MAAARCGHVLNKVVMLHDARDEDDADQDECQEGQCNDDRTLKSPSDPDHGVAPASSQILILQGFDRCWSLR